MLFELLASILFVSVPVVIISISQSINTQTKGEYWIEAEMELFIFNLKDHVYLLLVLLYITS